MIYADYAATSINKPKAVINAVTNALNTCGNASRGAHSASLNASRILFFARQMVCDFFEASSPAQVVFNSGITESLNTAISGIIQPNDTVVTTYAEHNSVLRPLYAAQKRGAHIIVTSPSVSDIEKALQKDAKAVIMTGGSNVTGEVYPIRKIGQLCKKYSALFILDAAQIAGVFPLSMNKDGIDVLCFSAHKSLLGPQGVGGLCVRKGIDIFPLMFGGSGMRSFLKEQPSQMPESLEAGTRNIPGIAGLASGLNYIAVIGIDKFRQHQQHVAKHFYKKVAKLPFVICYGENKDFSQRTGIVSLNIGQINSGKISDCLNMKYAIQTRPGAHCAPLMHEHYKTVEQGMVRFSFGHASTLKEADACAKAIEQIGGSL